MSCFKKILIGLAVMALAAGGMAGPAPAAPKTIRIAAVGDIMLGTENMLPADGAAAAFTEVQPYLKDCQVVIGNLEGPLTDRGAPTKEAVEGRSYVFRTPPSYVERLREAGFTVLSLANNHANDYGSAGSEQTREVLEKAGLLHTGAPGQVARQKVGKTTVSVIGLPPNSGCQDLNDLASASALIRQEASRDKTLVVVVFHGGAEGDAQTRVPYGMEYFLGERRGDIRRLSRAFVDAGAHLVIGHGPHVPRGLEIYQDRIIAYSLGNFATARGISISGRAGLAPLLLVEMTDKGKLVGGRVISFRQSTHAQPRFDSSSQAATLMHSVSLADFELPGLGADGAVITSETAARALAAGSHRPLQPTAVAKAEPVPEQEQAKPSGRPTRPASKHGVKPGRASKAAAKYEWDIYSGRLN